MVDVWLNLYSEGVEFTARGTRKDADRAAGRYRIACLHIEQVVPVGAGLDN
jgi:hypothetical protein